MNYLLPVNKTNEYIETEFEYNKQELNNILDDQILISQLSNGITFEDTNNMDSYERKYILKRILILEEEKAKAKEEAIKNAQNKR